MFAYNRKLHFQTLVNVNSIAYTKKIDYTP